MSNPASPAVDQLADQLVHWFGSFQAEYPLVVVAFSGGVDSAVVAKAAFLSDLPCLAFTGCSPSVAARELRDARSVAASIGIRHDVVATEELDHAAYRANAPDRCYHCKSHLYARIRLQYPDALIVSGTNEDDLGDYRPGLAAAREQSVRAPLAEMRIGKLQVRQIAEYWQLTVAAKPASPCLASRLAYGVSVTPERLGMVEQAEALLRDMGMSDCRVRLHPNNLARIEIPLTELPGLVESEALQELAQQIKSLGFTFVTLDLQGLRSGSLNHLILEDGATSGQ